MDPHNDLFGSRWEAHHSVVTACDDWRFMNAWQPSRVPGKPLDMPAASVGEIWHKVQCTNVQSRSRCRSVGCWDLVKTATCHQRFQSCSSLSRKRNCQSDHEQTHVQSGHVTSHHEKPDQRIVQLCCDYFSFGICRNTKCMHHAAVVGSGVWNQQQSKSPVKAFVGKT